jgi:hypothetical protein
LAGARANLAQTRGDLVRARALWRELFVDERAPMGIRVASAEQSRVETLRSMNCQRFARKSKAKVNRKFSRAGFFSLRMGELVTPKLSAPSTRFDVGAWIGKSESRRSGARDLGAFARDSPVGTPEASSTRAPDDATRRLALSHLVTLAARRGDVAASLSAFRTWSETLGKRNRSQNARILLFEAWQKAFKREVIVRRWKTARRPQRNIGGCAFVLRLSGRVWQGDDVQTRARIERGAFSK